MSRDFTSYKQIDKINGVYSRIPKKTLSPDDVPGAYINIDNFESCSIVQLKRWLECRGLKTTGNKPDLLQR